MRFEIYGSSVYLQFTVASDRATHARSPIVRFSLVSRPAHRSLQDRCSSVVVVGRRARSAFPSCATFSAPGTFGAFAEFDLFVFRSDLPFASARRMAPECAGVRLAAGLGRQGKVRLSEPERLAVMVGLGGRDVAAVEPIDLARVTTHSLCSARLLVSCDDSVRFVVMRRVVPHSRLE